MNPPFRQLWQVPTFFVGLLALALVVWVRPMPASTPGRQLQRELAAARRVLTRPQPDLPEVVNLGERILVQVEPSSPQAAEAHFLMGSAHLFLAERSGADSQAWQKARSHLEQAAKLEVPEGDRLKLSYRLGKVYAKLNTPAEQVVASLSPSVADAGDDSERFEGYALLARAYLQLSRPDLRAALNATQKQLALPNSNPSALAQPRLLCGELLMKLDQPDEARRVLSRIGPGASTEILCRAHALLARLYQDEGAWGEAARLWEEARGNPQAAGYSPAHISYGLGFCYRKLEQIKEATAAWGEIWQGGGEEGQAAAFGLAELRLRDNSASALQAFEAAVKNVASLDDYRNSLFSLTDAQNLFEAGCRYYRQIGQYELAQKLAGLYEKLAPPGVAQELTGETAEIYAQALLDSAKVDPTKKAQCEEAAKVQYRLAGQVFEKAAARTSVPAQQADWLWRSADDYRRAQDLAQAIVALDQLIRLTGLSPERQGEALYWMAEAYRALNKESAARVAYQRCIEFPTPLAYRARLQLALAEIRRGNLKDANTILQQNLDLMNQNPDLDAEAHEKTVFTLADLLFQQGEYRGAYDRFQEGLKNYPANTNAVQYRFQLALCCRKLADLYTQKLNGPEPAAKPPTIQHYRMLRSQYLELAAMNYQKLADDLIALQKSRRLESWEDDILRKSEFAVADCRFELGQFDDALRLYENLANRYRKQIEELIALRGVWQCRGVKFQPEQARAVLDRMRTVLKDISFDESNDLHSRRWWLGWLDEKTRQLDAQLTPRAGTPRTPR